MQQGIVNVWEPPLIAPDRLTIAGLARQHGYRTGCVGKWHLGWDWPITTEQLAHFRDLGGRTNGDRDAVVATAAQRATWRDVFSQPIGGGPTTRGFDIYFGTDVPNWPPYCFLENERTVGIPSELLPAELLTDNLASLPGPALRDWQLQAILPTLADRACAFITESAKNPAPFLLYLPLTSPHTPLAVNDAWKGRSGLESSVADLVIETDAVVQRVLDALEQSGVAEDTLVIFTSDNGFAPYTGAEHLKARGHFPSGPLRGYKGDAWEGGHRVPFLVRWPGVTKPGKACGQLVHQADLLATIAEILGTTLPDNAGEDSVSLLPLFRGADQPVRGCDQSGFGWIADFAGRRVETDRRSWRWRWVEFPVGRTEGNDSGPALSPRYRSRRAAELVRRPAGACGRHDEIARQAGNGRSQYARGATGKRRARALEAVHGPIRAACSKQTLIHSFDREQWLGWCQATCR